MVFNVVVLNLFFSVSGILITKMYIVYVTNALYSYIPLCLCALILLQNCVCLVLFYSQLHISVKRFI